MSIHHVPKPAPSANSAAKRSLLGRWAASTRDVLLSSEVKALARRIYLSDPWGTPARWGIDRFPQTASRLKNLIKPDEGFVYRPNPVRADELAPFTVDPIHAAVSADKARRMLGYRPAVPREEALELTLAWARYARIVPGTTRAAVPATQLG
jgi:hypothetical protein